MGMYPRFGGVSKLYICPCCKKYFFVPFSSKGGGRNEYVFKKRVKNQMIYVCSYTCYRSWFGEINRAGRK